MSGPNLQYYFSMFIAKQAPKYCIKIVIVMVVKAVCRFINFQVNYVETLTNWRWKESYFMLAMDKLFIIFYRQMNRFGNQYSPFCTFLYRVKFLWIIIIFKFIYFLWIENIIIFREFVRIYIIYLSPNDKLK